MLSTADIERLRDDLLAAGYTIDGLGQRLGDPALAGLGRNTSVAASRALADDRDPQAAAIRLLLLQQPVPAAQLHGWASLPGLREAGLVSGEDELRATVEIKPHGSDRTEGWICSDVTPLDGEVGKPREDFVLGASPASTTLSQLVPPGRYGRALDLGTGCGIQALHLDAAQIVATDLNPRALDLARISLGLSGVPAELRLGSLYEPVAGEAFDLIVTNPPYVMSPPGDVRLVYREGGFTADDLVRQVVTGGADHLADDGMMTVLCNWAVTADQPWEERLAELDRVPPAAMRWCSSGNSSTRTSTSRSGSPTPAFPAPPSTSTAIAPGWTTSRAQASRPSAWGGSPSARPDASARPSGSTTGRTPSTSRWGRPSGTSSAPSSRRGSPKPDFLARSWRTHPGLVQETIGEPGAADPQHLVLRQQYGFGRAVEADTALAAIVGACDGDLPLGVLVGAVAGLLDVDAEALRDEVVPPLRRLVVRRVPAARLSSQVLTGTRQPGHWLTGKTLEQHRNGVRDG